MKKEKSAIRGMICFLALLGGVFATSRQIRADTKYGQNMLSWKDLVFVSDSEGIYFSESDQDQWRTLVEGGTGIDYFAEDDLVYFINQEQMESYLFVYDIQREEADVIKTLKSGSRLAGKMGDSLIYLEPDEEYGANDGKLLKSVNIETKEVSKIAGNVGAAGYWDGNIIFTGAASDASPVKMMMLFQNGDFGLVDEKCGMSYYAGEEGFYYFRYEMTDDSRWSAVTLCTIAEEGRRDLITFDGEYGMASILNVKDGYINVSYTCNNQQLTVGVDAESGQYDSMDIPVPGKIPTAFQDGPITYWYSDGSIYYWKGAGYRRVAEIPDNGVVIGIVDGKVYFRVYKDGSMKVSVLTM